jgi:hypothetical protein
MFTMTKAEALKIQADQIAWYNRNGDRPWLAEKIAAMTTADALEDGKEYPVHVVNRCIPRGTDIERLCAIGQPRGASVSQMNAPLTAGVYGDEPGLAAPVDEPGNEHGAHESDIEMELR